MEAQKNLNLNEKKREGRDLLTYMVEANLSGGEALSRQQIIGDVRSWFATHITIQLIASRYSNSSLLHTKPRLDP